MDRITKNQLEIKFEFFKNVLGKTANAWVLDYVPEYGGYVIERVNENGSVSDPFGSERRTTREMYNVLLFALRTIAIERDPESKSGAYWPQIITSRHV